MQTIPEATVTEGSIFSYSWGYDQTNVDYYQVVKKSGSMLTLRKIGARSVEATGPMSDSVVPQKDAFLEARCDDCGRTRETHEGEHRFKDRYTIRKRLQIVSDRPYLAFPHGCGQLFDGRPEHRSWYA